jgi:hypothetical protein
VTACGALCQSERSTVDLFQRDVSTSPEVDRQETRTSRSLPDAPSARLPTQAEKFHIFADEARWPFTHGAAAINAGVIREAEPGHLAAGSHPTFVALHRAGFAQNESSSFFGKYLCPSLLKRNVRYHPSTSGSVMNRATYAASGIFITRDDSGKRRLNTSYFLGVLSSVAGHHASRPYWMRSAAVPFNDFGSTIGNDAGINLFHEFGPGIQQMVKGHTPKFMFRIEKRITPDQRLRQVVSSPAR